jgi:hypothetical protein
VKNVTVYIYSKFYPMPHMSLTIQSVTIIICNYVSQLSIYIINKVVFL